MLLALIIGLMVFAVASAFLFQDRFNSEVQFPEQTLEIEHDDA